jgi:hypothetical protein
MPIFSVRRKPRLVNCRGKQIQPDYAPEDLAARPLDQRVNCADGGKNSQREHRSGASCKSPPSMADALIL